MEREIKKFKNFFDKRLFVSRKIQKKKKWSVKNVGN
jgi:hypothetical protein